MSLVRVERAGPVTRLALCRAHMHNALVPELLDDVLAALREIASDANCAALILAADGPAFSIGGDMRRFQRERDGGGGGIHAYSADLVGKLNATILALIDLPQPVIAAVHGAVTGGSLGLVLACDLVYVSPGAVFKAHYASVGFAPDGGWTALLGRVAGVRRSAGAILLNRTVRADEAVAWGIANEVVAAADLHEHAWRAARRVAAAPSGTVRAAKRQLWGQREEIVADLEAERRQFLELIVRPETLAGIDAFLEKFSDYPEAEGSV